jgi:DSF synthase
MENVNGIKKILQVTEPLPNVYIFEMKIKGRKVFSIELLKELLDALNFVANAEQYNQKENKFFVFTGENNTGVFNYGGDLMVFLDYIERADIDSLKGYGSLCIDCIHTTSDLTYKNVTTVAIINGDARGGGLESAIACDIIIAEKGWNISLPEVKYGFFPGMGAFEFLSKRIGVSKAKSFIENDMEYTTDYLFEIGLFNYLVEKGDGINKLLEIVKKERSNQSKYNGLRRIYKKNNPITKEMLLESVYIWAESIIDISDYNKRKMATVIKIQEKKALKKD